MNQEILYRYLNNEATEIEIQEIFDWIESSPGNKEEFIAYKKIWALTGSSEDSKILIWNNLRSQVFHSNKKSWFWKYAAIFIFLLGIAGAVQLWKSSVPVEDQNGVVLETGENYREILLPDDDKIILGSEGEVVAEQKNDEIIYKNKPEKTRLVYHTINVPYGKTFKLQLADGSKIHLNAGTTLKFPEQFTGNSREVFLKGEAFFDITTNKDKPFSINTGEINVEVLGTRFNVHAYPEDKTIETVLVEGVVQVSQTDTEAVHTLSPNEKAIWDSSEEIFIISKVRTDKYLAWRSGDLVFQDIQCVDIFKKLERAYNVKIINKNELLSRQTYTGTFNIHQISLTQILELLRIDTPFTYYKDGSTIIIPPSETN